MARDKIVQLRDYLVGAAGDFPGAMHVEVVEDELGMFSVQLESGEEMFIAIAAIVS